MWSVVYNVRIVCVGMEKMTFFYALLILGIFASSCSQILLKKSADMKHRSWIGSMLNWRVITAYLIFFSSLFINITAMGNGVEMKELPIMESLGYVFVPILSYFFIGEKITKRVCLSMAFILLGIYVFYLK